MFKRTVNLALLGLAFFLPLLTGAPLFELNPANGLISGFPGQTVGWGFTITNPDDNFLVVSGSDFCVGPITSPCTNPLGAYSDYIGPQFVVVGPAPEQGAVTGSFDAIALTGVGGLTINPGASPGAMAQGDIVVTYDLYSVSPNDPTFNPVLDTLSNGNRLEARAKVTVASLAVPEPNTIGLVGLALFALAGVRVLRLRHRAKRFWAAVQSDTPSITSGRPQ